MSNTGSNAMSVSADPNSPEIMLTKQLARKLHLEHSKRAVGASVSWKSAPVEERKIWWVLAKSAVHMLKKNGYAKV